MVMKLVTVVKATSLKETPKETMMAKITTTNLQLLNLKTNAKLLKQSTEKHWRRSEENRLKLLKKLRLRRPSNEINNLRKDYIS